MELLRKVSREPLSRPRRPDLRDRLDAAGMHGLVAILGGYLTSSPRCQTDLAPVTGIWLISVRGTGRQVPNGSSWPPRERHSGPHVQRRGSVIESSTAATAPAMFWPPASAWSRHLVTCSTAKCLVRGLLACRHAPISGQSGAGPIRGPVEPWSRLSQAASENSRCGPLAVSSGLRLRAFFEQHAMSPDAAAAMARQCYGGPFINSVSTAGSPVGGWCRVGAPAASSACTVPG